MVLSLYLEPQVVLLVPCCKRRFTAASEWEGFQSVWEGLVEVLYYLPEGPGSMLRLTWGMPLVTMHDDASRSGLRYIPGHVAHALSSLRL